MILSIIASEVGLSFIVRIRVDAFVPAFRMKLCTEDHRTFNSHFNDLQQVVYLIHRQFSDQPFVENQQVDISICFYDLAEITVCVGDAQFIKKLRHAIPIQYRREIRTFRAPSSSSHPLWRNNTSHTSCKNRLLTRLRRAWYTDKRYLVHHRHWIHRVNRFNNRVLAKTNHKNSPSLIIYASIIKGSSYF